MFIEMGLKGAEKHCFRYWDTNLIGDLKKQKKELSGPGSIK